jgi:hypothetical protein
MDLVPVVLSCGCIYDPNLDGKPDWDHFSDGRPVYNITFAQGKCREIGDAAALNPSVKNDIAFIENARRHDREIEEYRRRTKAG